MPGSDTACVQAFHRVGEYEPATSPSSSEHPAHDDGHGSPEDSVFEPARFNGGINAQAERAGLASDYVEDGSARDEDESVPTPTEACRANGQPAHRVDFNSGCMPFSLQSPSAFNPRQDAADHRFQFRRPRPVPDNSPLQTLGQHSEAAFGIEGLSPSGGLTQWQCPGSGYRVPWSESGIAGQSPLDAVSESLKMPKEFYEN
eukprot:1829900-Rhodomonas_salina.1